MKRYLGLFVFLSLSLLLCAQPIANVRISQDIRYQGNVLKSSANETWVLWEENAGSGYQIQAQKYNSLGDAAFYSPITIPTGTGSVTIVETVASSDGGIILLYMQEIELQVILKVQKLDSLGKAQWTENGIYVAPILQFKFMNAKLCANSLGGAFLVHRSLGGQNQYIFHCVNYDAAGSNIWTAGNEISLPSANKLKQLLLTDAGELIIIIATNSRSYIRKVDDNGNTIGSDPMFSPAAVIPMHAKMQKANNGNTLIFSTNPNPGSPLQMQIMDADGSFVYSELKQIHVGFIADYDKDFLFAASSDGGFILSYLTGPNQNESTRELRVQRLSANLDPMWGSENPLILSDTYHFANLDMLVDAADNTWLSILRAWDLGNNMQVEMLKLNSDGSPAFDPQTVSISSKTKHFPKYSLLSDKIMLCWSDYGVDHISLLKQILTLNGDPLLPENGVPISSRLIGSADLYGIYSLGSRTICLMHDNRRQKKQIYYQVLDSGLSPYLQENGQALWLSDGDEQTITAAKVSPQNTLYLLYHKINEDALNELYLQEIDAAGNLLYPEGGLLLKTSEYFVGYEVIGFEAESAYIYWAHTRSVNGLIVLRIEGQKIEDGAIQWEDGGIFIYSQDNHDVTPLDAHGRFLVFVTRNYQQSFSEVRALHIEPIGTLDANWNSDGVSIIAEGLSYGWFAKTGMIQNDLYGIVTIFENGAYSLRAQKMNTSGTRLWGDSGLTIYNANQVPQMMNVIFKDQISLTHNDGFSDIYMQKLDTDGNMLFAEGGIMVPGNPSFANSWQLAQYANGTYSHFWREGSQDYEPYLRHMYISPEGSFQESQLIHEADFGSLYTTICDNSVVVCWSEENSDVFSWDAMSSVRVTALTEHSVNADITSEPVSVVSLNQNSPNPFTGSTRISYKLREASPVKLQIFNIKGQLVHELPPIQKAAGEYSCDWDGRDAQGKKCAGGIYLYRVHTGKHSASKKMVLLN